MKNMICVKKKEDWKVKGKYEDCESCMKGKARQKPMEKIQVLGGVV